jgi:hypothetical protein
MARPITLLTAVILLMAVIAPMSAHAQPNVLDFNVYIFLDGGTVTIPEGEDVYPFYAWDAGTPGLVKMYIKASNVDLTLYDSDGNVVWTIDPDTADDYWSELLSIPAEPEIWGIECNKKLFWISFWSANMGPLEAGTYTLVTTHSLDHPVNDLYHVCDIVLPDGSLIDVPPPSLISPGSFTSTVTINIVP